MPIQSVSAAVTPAKGLLALGALIALCTAAFVLGREARITAERAEIALIHQQDRAFCGSLGLAEGSDADMRCMNGLIGIRRQQKERLDRDSMGLP